MVPVLMRHQFVNGGKGLPTFTPSSSICLLNVSIFRPVLKKMKFVFDLMYSNPKSSILAYINSLHSLTFFKQTEEHPLIFLAVLVSSYLHKPTHSPNYTLSLTFKSGTPCRHIAIIDDGRIIEDAKMSTVLRKLQREVLILSLTGDLAAAPKLDGFETRLRDDCELEVEKGPDHDINDLFEQLSAHGIRVSSMRNKANRLEELFLRLVDSKRTPRETA